MKEPQNREVDDRTYQLRVMGPKLQIKTLKFIAKIAGKPIAAATEVPDILDEDGKKKGVIDNPKVVGVFIKEALDNADPDEIIEWIEKWLPYIERKTDNGYKQLKLETDFEGELPHLFKVVGAFLEVNFGSFLGVGTGLIKGLRDRLTKNSRPSSEAAQ